MVAREFQSDRTHATAALQAYMILIGRAANQQTIQYRQLSEAMQSEPSNSHRGN
jgi:hypothetical protein